MIPAVSAWLLLYPDTYEMGCPTKGSRSSTKSSTKPRRLGGACLRPLGRHGGRHAGPGIPLFSVEQHLPANAFDVLAFNLSAELV